MKKGLLALPILATTIAATFTSFNSTAGVYTDDLSKYLVASTTVTDRNNLVRWMFAAAAKTPCSKRDRYSYPRRHGTNE
ncbi:MAG: hypothetical protein MK214_08185 [Thalassotalea sp.]|nr:hypothetical protein [Thalassotalea sp.]